METHSCLSAVAAAAQQQVHTLQAELLHLSDVLLCFRFTFDVPKTKCVVHDGDRQDVRLLLLKEELDPTGERIGASSSSSFLKTAGLAAVNSTSCCCSSSAASTTTTSCSSSQSVDSAQVSCTLRSSCRLMFAAVCTLTLFAALAPEVTSILQQHGEFEVTAHEVQLNYKHLSADAVLKVRRKHTQTPKGP